VNKRWIADDAAFVEFRRASFQRLEKAKERFCPHAFRRSQSYQSLDFAPVRFILDFDLQKYKNVNLCSFSSKNCGNLCNNSNRKLLYFL
jgi:hypothetical protein